MFTHEYLYNTITPLKLRRRRKKFNIRFKFSQTTIRYSARILRNRRLYNCNQYFRILQMVILPKDEKARFKTKQRGVLSSTMNSTRASRAVALHEQGVEVVRDSRCVAFETWTKTNKSPKLTQWLLSKSPRALAARCADTRQSIS
jgi:hypothetical protein